MVRKRKRRGKGVKALVLLLVILIPLFSIFALTGFKVPLLQETAFVDVSSGGVWLPQFGRLKCDLQRSLKVAVDEVVPVSGKWYRCGDLGVYTDLCRYEISFVDTGRHILEPSEEWICRSSFGGDVPEGEKCRELETRVSDFPDFEFLQSVNLDNNGDGFIDTRDSDIFSQIYVKPAEGGLLTKDVKMKVRVNANQYRLVDISGLNFATTFEEGCDLSQIEDIHPTEEVEFLNIENSKSQIPFGHTLNYVWGLTPAITSDIIRRDGEDVFVLEAGSYHPIKETVDGVRYVDVREKVRDDNVECRPSNLFICNSDATFRPEPSTDLTGQDCSLIRGVVPDTFYKVAEDEVCTFECKDGKINQDDCEKIKVCKEGFDLELDKNRCVKVGVTQPPSGLEEVTCKPILAFQSLVFIPSFEKDCLGFFAKLGYGLSLLALLIVPLIFSSLLKKYKLLGKKGGQAVLKVVLSIVVGFIMFFLINSIIWLGLALVVLLFIINMAIKKVTG